MRTVAVRTQGGGSHHRSPWSPGVDGFPFISPWGISVATLGSRRAQVVGQVLQKKHLEST